MAEKPEKKRGEEGAVTLTHRISEKADKLKWIAIAVIVLLLAVAAVFSYQRRRSAAREVQAENALFQAVINLSGNPEAGAGIAVFGRIAKDFEGLPAAARALIFQFAYAFNTREFAAAEQSARDFLRLHPLNPLARRMRVALGQSLVQQGKFSQAVAALREAVSDGGEIMPEAKLALAQALEREAEEARDNPEEYRRRLEAARAEFNDIVVRSQIVVPSQRGYWPSEVVLPADFSLAAINDRLAGVSHPSPRPVENIVLTPADLEGARVAAPPLEDPATGAAPEGEEDGGEENPDDAPPPAPNIGDAPVGEEPPAEGVPTPEAAGTEG